MKSLLKISIFTLALATAAEVQTAYGRVGGIGDGGGHGFSSTPQDVRDYLEKPWAAWGGSQAEVDRRSTLATLDHLMMLSPEYAPNDIVKKILVAIQEAYPGKKISNATGNKTIAISESCYDRDGALSDGATTIGKLDSPICMNVNSLARYPAEELRSEVIALFFHEWAHQLGFGEAEAVEMQNYVKHLLPLMLAMGSGSYPKDLPLRAGGIRTVKIQGKDPVTVFCISNEDYWKGFNKNGHAEFPGSGNTMTIFTGQAVVVGGGTVACSDMPQIDCRVEPSNDDDCRGSYVAFGKSTNHRACLGSSMFRYADLPELRAAKICK